MTALADRTGRGSRWRRKLAAFLRRGRFMPLVEIGAAAVAIAIGFATYGILSGQRAPGPLTPALVSSLLLANLIPALVLLMLLGRRVAKRRAELSPVGGSGRLHVRLVAIFSLLASVPMVLLVIVASLLFQYGVEFWFSDQARSSLENAREVGQDYYERERGEVARNTVVMAGDLSGYLTEYAIQSPEFASYYGYQVFGRELNESAIVALRPDGSMLTEAIADPDQREVQQRVTADAIRRLRAGAQVVLSETDDRVEAVTRLTPGQDVYLYASRAYDPEVVRRSEAVLSDYNNLLDRSRKIQLRFNAALYLVSLFIVGLAVLIALRVADRLVRPVGELVGAARRVAEGDLSARVARPKSRDEVGTLASAFNQMTRQLETQTSALVAANDQLDSRRAFTEAVLSGVSAGVVSVDDAGIVRLINNTAAAFLSPDEDAVGRPLADVAPELAALIGEGEREAVAQLARAGETRTLAVKLVRDDRGTVLTFDDITQQLADQRRAAWADVARRIAHEIKNPLTPNQLAAERLQRRYGREVTSDPGVFQQLTETIVRQVGDLRRMVDEFSSFARMPKPVFRPENPNEMARQALFLQEVAHPAIAFRLTAAESPPVLVCDRSQLGQAFTNLLKNGVEAVEGRLEREGEGAAPGEIALSVCNDATDQLRIVFEDNGIGLPAERERIVEPYVTTRSKGTGLGLAIVKKIVEEHGGTLSFADRAGGGTTVSLRFDPQQLARLAGASADTGTTDRGDAPRQATMKAG